MKTLGAAQGSHQSLTIPSGVHESLQRAPEASWFVFSQHESDPANRVNRSLTSVDVNLPSPANHLDIDEAVDGRGATRLLPDVVREHLAGYVMSLVP